MRQGGSVAGAFTLLTPALLSLSLTTVRMVLFSTSSGLSSCPSSSKAASQVCWCGIMDTIFSALGTLGEPWPNALVHFYPAISVTRPGPASE